MRELFKQFTCAQDTSQDATAEHNECVDYNPDP